MGLFFNYDNPVCNEGSTPVAFSYDPSISSLKELLLYEISQMSYYEVKMRELGENTERIADSVINYITLIVVNLDFKKDRFLTIIKNLYDEVQKLNQTYKEICRKKNIVFEPVLGEKLSFDKRKSEIKAVNLGEKQSLIKNTVFTKNKKMLNDIAIMLISNACLCITEIEDYGQNAGDKKFKIPELLKVINYDRITEQDIKKKILAFAKVNREIMLQLNGIITENYGPVEETEVDLSIRKGKCILVSGHFYKNLEMLLEAAKDEDINIYTHNDMLFSHSFSYFRKYKNFAGHYQRSVNNLQLDFASFPGAVLITKNSHTNFDLIRGSIFTPDNNPAYGLGKISGNDFSPLIEASKAEKGFSKNIFVNTITVGFNAEEILQKLNNIIDDIKAEKYKHLFIVGAVNYNLPADKYFEKLMQKLPDDCFAITFLNNTDRKNIWNIKTFADMTLMYQIFSELKKYKNILKNKITVFIPQCHFQTISYAFNMKILGIKNIYLSECCPNIINPSLLKGLSKIFGIKKVSDNPENDLKDILKL